MADRRDRVRQLAGRRRMDPPHTGTHPGPARDRSLSRAAQSVLLYDEDCGFCRWSLDKILAWDRGKRVRPVAIQSEEGSRLLAPIASDTRLDSWHLVREDEQLFSAAAAAEPLEHLLTGGRTLDAVTAAY